MVMTKMFTKNLNSLQCNMGRLFQSDKRIFRSWEILVYFLFCDCKPSFFLNVIQVTSPSPSPRHRLPMSTSQFYTQRLEFPLFQNVYAKRFGDRSVINFVVINQEESWSNQLLMISKLQACRGGTERPRGYRLLPPPLLRRILKSNVNQSFLSFV